MKPFTYAIASIVDSNTGYGLPRDVQIDYQSYERNARRSRATAFINLLVRVRAFLGTIPHRLRQRRKLARSVRELSALNDRMLEDIGFTRGDVLAAQSGQLDRAGLEARRVKNRGNQRIRVRDSVTRVQHLNTTPAFNEAVFARARCA